MELFGIILSAFAFSFCAATSAYFFTQKKFGYGALNMCLSLFNLVMLVLNVIKHY